MKVAVKSIQLNLNKYLKKGQILFLNNEMDTRSFPDSPIYYFNHLGPNNQILPVCFSFFHSEIRTERKEFVNEPNSDLH